MTVSATPCIKDGRLTVNRKTVTKGVPSNVFVAPSDSESSWALLGATSAIPSSRHVFRLGVLDFFTAKTFCTIEYAAPPIEKPANLDWFGWCTWDALYKHVSPQAQRKTPVARVSEDFMPREPLLQTLHVASVAFKSLLTGEIVVPDWDMFQNGTNKDELMKVQ
ncbi:hypothetical protein RJ639_004557 [Escallonia herrerae]|uniref:Uncharacterized protein n=1 Tax=Escallonia herrerae TaxID=1293975 RepID=A0AA89AWF1_9ASTE|nr:hypothetical protein RJ639_004557 [Escallonia herrerae]